MTIQKVDTQPAIAAGRLALRSLRPSDAGLLTIHSGDERVARATRSIPHPLPPGTVEAFLDRAADPARSEDVWAIDGSAVGLPDLVGVLELDRMDREQSEIGYWVAPPFWNSGIASDAVRALVAANPQSCRTIFAEVFQDNPASARVLTNAGFAYLGDAETFSVARDARVQTWTYSLKMD